MAPLHLCCTNDNLKGELLSSDIIKGQTKQDGQFSFNKLKKL